jgi:hypothetical protein
MIIAEHQNTWQVCSIINESYSWNFCSEVTFYFAGNKKNINQSNILGLNPTKMVLHDKKFVIIVELNTVKPC